MILKDLFVIISMGSWYVHMSADIQRGQERALELQAVVSQQTSRETWVLCKASAPN